MADYTIQNMSDKLYDELRHIGINKKKSVKDMIVEAIEDYVKKHKK